ncbi:hypothetical protein GCM10009087_05990 [Sphingomonas oligophenolica]
MSRTTTHAPAPLAIGKKMTNPFEFAGKVAIVTGANTGIGHIVAVDGGWLAR